MNKSNLIRFSGIFWFISLALFLPGCFTTATTIKNTSELNQVGKDSSIVFGRIQWLEKGKEKKSGLTPLLFKVGDEGTIRGELSETGDFVWPLKAGEYKIYGILYSDVWAGHLHVNFSVYFSVPENGKVYYVGVLRCECDINRFWRTGKVKFTIQDEGGQDFAEFQDKFSIPSKDIEKSLMIDLTPINVAPLEGPPVFTDFHLLY